MFSAVILGFALATSAGCADPALQADGALSDESVESVAEDLTGNFAVGTSLVTTSAVNLRKGPSTEEAVLKLLPAGTVVKSASASAKGVWYGVSVDGLTGWVHGAYLKKSDGACRPSKDRTANTVDELPFQTLDKGALPTAMTHKQWAYPWKNGAMNQTFGAGRSYNEGHEGTDLGGAKGDSIHAAGSGRVVYAMKSCTDNDVRKDKVCGNGWGNHIVIDHGDGVFTRYAHLSRLDVAVGSTVSKGSVIGALGHSGLSDGPHLHFELGVKSTAFSPCAPPQNFDKVYNPAKLKLDNH
jgi:murein DD-endopeptidase MepM/ murein hydrolase activator NlpD